MLLVWVFGLLAAVSAGLATFAGSALIELEYVDFHEQWLQDGRPVGGKRSRGAASFWLSGFSRNIVLQRWLMSTPTWAQGHERAMGLLKRFRLSAAAMILSILGLFLTTFYVASH